MGIRHERTLAIVPHRRLSRQFDAAGGKGGDLSLAAGNVSPNTLNGNKPLVSDAMGMSGSEGMVSFLHNGATQDFTLYIWCGRLKEITAAQGWALANEATAGHTKNIAQYSICTFTIPENTPWYLKATGTDVTELIVTGAAHKDNPNTSEVGIV